MKKVLLLVLAAIMCMSLFACGEVTDGVWEAEVEEITEDGRLVLDVTQEDLAEANIVPKNFVVITPAENEARSDINFSEKFIDAQVPFIWYNEENGAIEYVNYAVVYEEAPVINEGDKVIIKRQAPAGSK